MPLQIHPAWAEEGIKSPALKAFNNLILKYIGIQNLSAHDIKFAREKNYKIKLVPTAFMVNKNNYQDYNLNGQRI